MFEFEGIFWKWIGYGLANITGVAVSFVIVDATHLVNKPWGWLLFTIIWVGVGAVVEHAVNGPMRLGLAFDNLESKIAELERSIEEMRRAVDKRL